MYIHIHSLNNMKTIKSKALIASLDSGLYGAKNFGESLALIFNENVKFDKFLIRKQVESIQSFSNKYVHQRSCQPYKVFPTSKEYDLKPYLMDLFGFFVGLLQVNRQDRQ